MKTLFCIITVNSKLAKFVFFSRGRFCLPIFGASILLQSCSLFQETTPAETPSTQYKIINISTLQPQVFINDVLQAPIEFGQTMIYNNVEGGDVREIKIANALGEVKDSVLYEVVAGTSTSFFISPEYKLVNVQDETGKPYPGTARVRYINFTAQPNVKTQDNTNTLSPTSALLWYEFPKINGNEFFNPIPYIKEVEGEGADGFPVISTFYLFRDYSTYQVLPAGSSSFYLTYGSNTSQGIPNSTYEGIMLKDGHIYSLVVTDKLLLIDESGSIPPVEILPTPPDLARVRFYGYSASLKSSPRLDASFNYSKFFENGNDGKQATLSTNQHYLLTISEQNSLLPIYFEDSISFNEAELYSIITAPTEFNSVLDVLLVKEKSIGTPLKTSVHVTNLYIGSADLVFKIIGEGTTNTIEDIDFKTTTDYVEVDAVDANNFAISYTIRAELPNGTLLTENFLTVKNGGAHHILISGTAFEFDAYRPQIFSID
jgi:hypothetical protein